MQTRPGPNQNQRRLYELAESQGGYFTSGQAAELGYSGSKRNYHVGAGNWTREAHGIYRLVMFPRPKRPDLLLWWLWSRDRSGTPLGVYGHRTALTLHDLTDQMPAKIDMIVPKRFRRGATIPRVLKLHYADLRPEEIERIDDVPATTPLRTFFDLWQSEEVPLDVIRSAFKAAADLGKITRKELSKAAKNPGWEEMTASLGVKI